MDTRAGATTGTAPPSDSPPSTSRTDDLEMLNLNGFLSWVLCFCVVTFDLEKGQALELVYPPITLSPEEKKNMLDSVGSIKAQLISFLTVDPFLHSPTRIHPRMLAILSLRFECGQTQPRKNCISKPSLVAFFLKIAKRNRLHCPRHHVMFVVVNLPLMKRSGSPLAQ